MNQSGMIPKGNRVVVLPDVIEEKTKGGIVIPISDKAKRQMAQHTGVLIAVGKDVWKHVTKNIYRLFDGQMKLVEQQISGYSEDFAKVGDRVCFAKFNGLQFDGDDGKQYRLLNDEDITGVVSDAMDLTDLKVREPISQVK